MSSADGIADAQLVTCNLCGRTDVGPSLSWMYEHDQGRGGVWYCESCAHHNLRAVEAKLDRQWW